MYIKIWNYISTLFRCEFANYFSTKNNDYYGTFMVTLKFEDYLMRVRSWRSIFCKQKSP